MEKLTNNSFGLILVTAPSREQAAAIAQTLVQCNLAACVSLFPIHSIYTWQGETQHDDEWQLVIKTNLAKFAELEAKIRTIHPYEVPEIIALPLVAGSAPYLQWIADHVGE